MPGFKPLTHVDIERMQARRDAVEEAESGYNFTGSPQTQYHHRQFAEGEGGVAAIEARIERITHIQGWVGVVHPLAHVDQPSTIPV